MTLPEIEVRSLYLNYCRHTYAQESKSTTKVFRLTLMSSSHPADRLGEFGSLTDAVDNLVDVICVETSSPRVRCARRRLRRNRAPSILLQIDDDPREIEDKSLLVLINTG